MFAAKKPSSRKKKADKAADLDREDDEEKVEAIVDGPEASVSVVVSFYHPPVPFMVDG